MSKPQYIIVGGFLGAGKTTAMLAMAKLLEQRGERVGLITNDQSVGLVDTALLESHGFVTEEITGGCFCCKFDSLVAAAEKLRKRVEPSIVLAEPVGSCTDIRSTVAYPLVQMHGSDFSIAPYSVLVDPLRAQELLGLTPGRNFSAKLQYIYEKQLEEADVIVINKIDLLARDERNHLADSLQRKWPHAMVMAIAARQRLGVAEWLEAILCREAPSSKSMEVDYDLYADGEALLGWLNLQASLAGSGLDGNRWLLEMADKLQSRLNEFNAEIAHLKMTLIPFARQDIAVVNVVRGNAHAELSHKLTEPLETGQLLVNLRAEADPELLKELSLSSLREHGELTPVSVEVQSINAFRPGRPTPTHRIAL